MSEDADRTRLIQARKRACYIAARVGMFRARAARQPTTPPDRLSFRVFGFGLLAAAVGLRMPDRIHATGAD
jgi:hypothetical protein